VVRAGRADDRGGTFRGSDAVAGFLAWLPQHDQLLRVVPVRLHEARDTVVVEGRRRGTVDGPRSTTTASPTSGRSPTGV